MVASPILDTPCLKLLSSPRSVPGLVCGITGRTLLHGEVDSFFLILCTSFPILHLMHELQHHMITTGEGALVEGVKLFERPGFDQRRCCWRSSSKLYWIPPCCAGQLLFLFLPESAFAFDFQFISRALFTQASPSPPWIQPTPLQVGQKSLYQLCLLSYLLWAILSVSFCVIYITSVTRNTSYIVKVSSLSFLSWPN